MPWATHLICKNPSRYSGCHRGSCNPWTRAAKSFANILIDRNACGAIHSGHMVAALQIPAERCPAFNISCTSDAWNGPASVPYTVRQKNGCTEPEKWRPNENASKPSPLQQSSQQRLNCLNLAQRITPPFRNLRDPVRNSRHATGHACCGRRTKAATPYRPSRLGRPLRYSVGF